MNRGDAREGLDRVGSFDWLLAILLSWIVPLGALGAPTYFSSLTLWAVPIVLLLPRFYIATHPHSRRRSAVYATGLYILILGSILDFIFGAHILKFERNDYLFCLPALGGSIPIEEVLFYVLGGFAIVLVYFWADEYWLRLYNVRRGRPLVPEPGHLIALSGPSMGWTLVLVAGGIALKAWLGAPGPMLPLYYTFLIVLSLVPAMILFKAVKDMVNWRAFSFTAIWVLLTAVIWEVTLGLPQKWWGYQDESMLGIFIGPWDATPSRYPLEALIVWVAVTFTTVLFYEAIKIYLYEDRPPKEILLGPAPWEIVQNKFKPGE